MSVHTGKELPPQEELLAGASAGGRPGRAAAPLATLPVPPRPSANHWAIRPPAARRRSARARMSMVRSVLPHPLAVGPSSRRKALWKAAHPFWPRLAGDVPLLERFGWLGSSRSQKPSEGPGAGRDPAASSSLGRPLPQAGRRTPYDPNAWRAAACFGLRHVVAETSGGSKRPRVCFSMPGDGAMGVGASQFIDCVSGNIQ